MGWSPPLLAEVASPRSQRCYGSQPLPQTDPAGDKDPLRSPQFIHGPWPCGYEWQPQCQPPPHPAQIPPALTPPGPTPHGVLCSSFWVPETRCSADPKPAWFGRACLGPMVGISWIGAISGQRQQAGGEHILQAPGQGSPFSSGQSLGPTPGSYVQPGLGLWA